MSLTIRQEMDFIPTATSGKLYLGGYWATYTEDPLERAKIHQKQRTELEILRIECIIPLGFEYSPFEFDFTPLKRTFYNSPIADDLRSITKLKMSIYMEFLGRMIRDELSSGRNVYVHCHAGISRSPTIILHYLVTYEGMSLLNAFEFLLKSRPCVKPNKIFWQLLEQHHQLFNSSQIR